MEETRRIFDPRTTNVAQELSVQPRLPALFEELVASRNISEAIIHARLSAHGISPRVIADFCAQYRCEKLKVAGRVAEHAAR